MASNNDCGVRDFDMEKFQICNNFRFAWPVNVKSSASSLILHFSVDFFWIFIFLVTSRSSSQYLFCQRVSSMWLENYSISDLVLPPV
jgi:hypothetical protein